MLQWSLLLGIVAASLVATSLVLAQGPSSSPAPAKSTTPSSIPIDEEKVKALKEKLATKVAELRENQTRGFFGEIAALSKTSFTFSDTMIPAEIHARIFTQVLMAMAIPFTVINWVIFVITRWSNKKF